MPKGYTKEQAEGFVEVVKQLNLDKMVTKEDLINLENRFDKKLDDKLEKLQMQIIIKVGSMLFLLGGFLTAIKFWN